MTFRALRLPGAWEITLKPIADARGYFVRTYARELFQEHGLVTEWVHENQSRSGRPFTLRGLHFQRPPHAETKLIRAVQGRVLDVLVDLRKDSPTYGQWDSVELSADNFRMAYVPKGFAHGFCTLTEECVVHYKVDAAYAPAHESGLPWNDPTLAIQWPTAEPILSDRDRQYAAFAQFQSPF
jgi:dTDP-4-dehydrorhamnose 3,5-epimerase